MPDQAPALTVVVDLHLEVSDHRGSTTAHLHNDARGLVVDVDEPGVLVRALPRRPALPGALRDDLAGMSARVRSGGVELGTVSVDDRGRARVRPTPAGVGTAARIVAHERPAWVAAAAVTLVLGATAVLRSLRNR